MSNQKFWHICCLRPRSEKKVLKIIEGLDYEVFLPMKKQMRIYKNAKKKVFLPFFPGYIFVNISPGFRHHITAISEVCRFLKFNDDYAKISQDEIKNLILINGCPDYHNDIAIQSFFEKGKDAEVIKGPFIGLRGKMIKNKGNNRIVVEIDAIKQGITINIDLKDLAPIDK